MSHDFNFQELKAADRLPSPPGVALSILQLVEQEDAAIEDLAKLVQADPALSSKLLRFANSPMVAPRRPIVAVQDAVTLIGMNGVRSLTLGLSLVGRYKTGECKQFDYLRYWSGSLALAVAMASLSSLSRLAAAEEGFTLGLLSDIGRLALATAWPDEYARCLVEGQEGEALRKLEKPRFGIDNVALTRLLLADWRLPEIFIESLCVSYEPGIERADRIGRLAHLFVFSRRVRQYCLAEESGREELMESLLQASEPLPLEMTLEEWLPQVIEEWHAWGRMIEVPTSFDKKPRRISTADEQGEATAPLKILLVDDDPMLLARLSKQLKNAGHQVVACRDGQQALSQVLKEMPQMVITDWHMKPVDGLALTRALRNSQLGNQLFIVMLTASESEDDLVEAFEAGIDDYVTKTVSFRVLQARIRAGQRILNLQDELQREHVELEKKARELALANRRLEQLANTDILTGLPNRRYALWRLRQEMAESSRSGQPLSVMILDLDRFKQINDTFGHEAGDRVLAHAAKVMRKVVRTSDIVCRFGGEEFLIIAPATGLEAGKKLAERIRHSLENNSPPGLELGRPVTASIGVACLSDAKHEDDVEIVRQADKALYRAKEGGRNRVEVATLG